MIRAADDPEVGLRLRALTARARNVCNRRLTPAEPVETCWCTILKDGDRALECPPMPELGS